jgi:hypothetical protein
MPIRKILAGTFDSKREHVKVAEVCNVLSTHAERIAYVVPNVDSADLIMIQISGREAKTMSKRQNN